MAALPPLLLNKNSSELSLLLFATAPFGALLKTFLVLFYSGRFYSEKPTLKLFVLKKVSNFLDVLS